MNTVKKLVTIILLGLFIMTLSGCAPKVGSEKWCAETKEKPKIDWTAGEAGDYAKHCIL